MEIKEIISYLEHYFPLNLALSWDNCGLQVGNLNNKVTNIMLALTADIDVIEECIEKNCNLLITHHPLLFSGIKTIDVNDPLGKIIHLALKNDICIYSLHTCLDIGLDQSMNQWLLEKLGFNEFENADDEGILKKTTCNLSLQQLSDLCKSKLNLPFTRTVGHLDSHISNFAIVGGSGADYILTAVNQKLDCLITGDLKYHDAQLAKQYGLNLIDIGHFAESIFVEKMAELLSSINIECIQSKQEDYFKLG